jgi:hypothetical protein
VLRKKDAKLRLSQYQYIAIAAFLQSFGFDDSVQGLRTATDAAYLITCNVLQTIPVVVDSLHAQRDGYCVSITLRQAFLMKMARSDLKWAP